MPTLKGLMVDLFTASNEDDTGTDDEIYIGFWGTGGGREFPLSSAEHEDFESGAQDRYILGVEPFIVPTAAVRPDRSEPGGANDPAALAVELGTIEYVYIRKQETRDNDDDPEDDAYKLLFVQVLLYEGPAALGTRSFSLDVREIGGLWLGHEFGHKAWLIDRARPVPGVNL